MGCVHDVGWMLRLPDGLRCCSGAFQSPNCSCQGHCARTTPTAMGGPAWVDDAAATDFGHSQEPHHFASKEAKMGGAVLMAQSTRTCLAVDVCAHCLGPSNAACTVPTTAATAAKTIGRTHPVRHAHKLSGSRADRATRPSRRGSCAPRATHMVGAAPATIRATSCPKQGQRNSLGLHLYQKSKVCLNLPLGLLTLGVATQRKPWNSATLTCTTSASSPSTLRPGRFWRAKMLCTCCLPCV